MVWLKHPHPPPPYESRTHHSHVFAAEIDSLLLVLNADEES